MKRFHLSRRMTFTPFFLSMLSCNGVSSRMDPDAVRDAGASGGAAVFDADRTTDDRSEDPDAAISTDVPLSHDGPLDAGADEIAVPTEEWVKIPGTVAQPYVPTRSTRVGDAIRTYFVRAGRVAYSVSPDGLDQSNVVFTNVQSLMGGSEAIIDHPSVIRLSSGRYLMVYDHGPTRSPPRTLSARFSDDGTVFGAPTLLPSSSLDASPGGDAFQGVPSILELPNGAIRVYYAANGKAVASVLSADGGATWTQDPGYRLGTGFDGTSPEGFFGPDAELLTSGAVVLYVPYQPNVMQSRTCEQEGSPVGCKSFRRAISHDGLSFELVAGDVLTPPAGRAALNNPDVYSRADGTWWMLYGEVWFDGVTPNTLRAARRISGESAIADGGTGDVAIDLGSGDGSIGDVAIDLGSGDGSVGDVAIDLGSGDGSIGDLGQPMDTGMPAEAPWAASLSVGPTAGTVVGSTLFSSSTRLAAIWALAPRTIDHYLVRAIESLGGSAVEIGVPGSDSGTTLEGLKSDTDYTVTVLGCLDSACAAALLSSGATVSARTPRETWKIHATGDDVASAIPIVSDGNVKFHAFTYGQGAPVTRTGRVQLYYGPRGQAFAGLTAGTGNASVVSGDVASAAAFTSHAGQAGLVSLMGGAATPLVRSIHTGQAVPLSASLGSKIRLFFESTGGDGRTRLLWLDSQDGHLGLDFHSGAAITCSTESDYGAGGGCAPSVAIGVSGDAGGSSLIQNARQSKIGVRTLDDWRWDGRPGTFMFVTVDANPSCSAPAFANQAYAVWNGIDAWDVQAASGSCPKLFVDVQAPSPVHTGGPTFKLYFGTPSITTGRLQTSQLPFLGPKRVLYADGARSGGLDRVDFEDWEPVSAAREIDFVWPSGRPLSTTEEGYMDDFVHVAPSGTLDFQVMYSAMTDGSLLPFGVAAVLVNP